MFFLAMHHYEAVNLSARAMRALWSRAAPAIITEVLLVRRERLTNSGNRCFIAFSGPHSQALWHVVGFWLILMKMFASLSKIIT